MISSMTSWSSPWHHDHLPDITIFSLTLLIPRSWLRTMLSSRSQTGSAARSWRSSSETSTSASPPARSAGGGSSWSSWSTLELEVPSKLVDQYGHLDLHIHISPLYLIDYLAPSLVDVNQSRDPDGLRCFYYLVQVTPFSFITLHYGG